VTERQDVEQRARTEAYDLALWRAAEIALANGYPGFRVRDTRTEVDAALEDYYGYGYGPGAFGGLGLGSGRFSGSRFSSVGLGLSFPLGGTGYRDTGSLQVSTTLDVELERELKPGDFDAQYVLEQARRTYPNASG
jgi:hypothetical protein